MLTGPSLAASVERPGAKWVTESEVSDVPRGSSTAGLKRAAVAEGMLSPVPASPSLPSSYQGWESHILQQNSFDIECKEKKNIGKSLGSKK